MKPVSGAHSAQFLTPNIYLEWCASTSEIAGSELRRAYTRRCRVGKWVLLHSRPLLKNGKLTSVAPMSMYTVPFKFSRNCNLQFLNGHPTPTRFFPSPSSWARKTSRATAMVSVSLVRDASLKDRKSVFERKRHYIIGKECQLSLLRTNEPVSERERYVL